MHAHSNGFDGARVLRELEQIVEAVALIGDSVRELLDEVLGVEVPDFVPEDWGLEA
jgi:hypothetical protein